MNNLLSFYSILSLCVFFGGGGDVSSELRRFALHEGKWRKQEDQQQHKLELLAEKLGVSLCFSRPIAMEFLQVGVTLLGLASILAYALVLASRDEFSLCGDSPGPSKDYG